MPVMNTGLTAALFGSAVGFVIFTAPAIWKLFSAGWIYFADVEHEAATGAQSELRHIAAGRKSDFPQPEKRHGTLSYQFLASAAAIS
jgi:hypothetical protein